MDKDQLKESVNGLILLRKAVESVDDIIVLQDIEGKYIYYNEAPVYGLKSKDVVGKTPFDFFDKDQANILIKRVKEVFVKGKDLNFETLVKWKGKKIWYNDTMTPLKDDDGHVEAVVTISRNITSHKEAKDELQKNIHELEEQQKLTVGRKMKMVDLKKEIRKLNEKLKEYEPL
jgi:PAS domain S-box-containing protein